MARRQIGTPRFYCDIPSYLKSIGRYYGVRTSGMTTPEIPNMEKVFTMNPYQVENYYGGTSHNWSSFNFFINQDPVGHNSQIYIQQDELAKLLSYHNPVGTEGEHHSSGWYAGILGHNFASRGVASISQRFIGVDQDGISTKYSNQSDFREIVNFKHSVELENVGESGIAEYDGYSLWEITSKNTGLDRFNLISFYITKHDGSSWLSWGNDPLKIGAYTCGIFVEPPHSPDLSVDFTLEQGGIKVYETVGGNSLVNIHHQGVPNWGDQPAWTLQKTDGRDYTTVASRSRRNWKLSFSYISDDNLFDAAQNSNSFYNDSFDDFGQEDAHSVANFDSSMSTFFKLTKNGNLPFIFCPDSKADNLEFAICMLDQDSISFKQIAYQTWNVSMNVREVW